MRMWETHRLMWDSRLGNWHMWQEAMVAYIRARQAREEGDQYYRFYVPDTDPDVIWFGGDYNVQEAENGVSDVSP